MNILKITLLSAFFILSSLSGYSQEIKPDEPIGTITYCLPQTSISIDVEVQKHFFFAGPYGKYAKKYLGIEVKQSDEVSVELTKISMRPLLEADQSQRFIITPGKQLVSFLQFTSQGLISTGDGEIKSAQWRFPPMIKSDFSDMGIGSNLTSESTILYKNVKNEESYNKIAVQQKMIVEKSLEIKAKEAADMIFSLRKKRVQIITGDTDATYSGEAMGAALKEISNLEKEYMTLFTGYTDTQIQKMNYEVIPKKDNKKQIYIAFRLSQNKGLVSADNMSGKPYMLLIDRAVMNPAESSKSFSSRGKFAYYRIPDICDVKLSDGVNILCQTRMSIYQLGIISSFPLED